MHRRVRNFGYGNFGYGNFGYGNFGFWIRFLDFGYGVLDTVLDTVLDILDIFLDILDTVLDTAKFWIRSTDFRSVSKKNKILDTFWIRSTLCLIFLRLRIQKILDTSSRVRATFELTNIFRTARW